jgi:hypothetical protein
MTQRPRLPAVEYGDDTMNSIISTIEPMVSMVPDEQREHARALMNAAALNAKNQMDRLRTDRLERKVCIKRAKLNDADMRIRELKKKLKAMEGNARKQPAKKSYPLPNTD